DQPAQLGVEVADRLGRRAQHRITEKTDRLDAHENPPEHITASTRVPWRRQPSVYPSGNLGRVELNSDDAAVLACAASGLRRVQRARQREAVSPADPDQRSFLRLGGGSWVLVGVPGGDGRDR